MSFLETFSVSKNLASMHEGGIGLSPLKLQVGDSVLCMHRCSMLLASII